MLFGSGSVVIRGASRSASSVGATGRSAPPYLRFESSDVLRGCCNTWHAQHVHVARRDVGPGLLKGARAEDAVIGLAYCGAMEAGRLGVAPPAAPPQLRQRHVALMRCIYVPWVSVQARVESLSLDRQHDFTCTRYIGCGISAKPTPRHVADGFQLHLLRVCIQPLTCNHETAVPRCSVCRHGCPQGLEMDYQ